MTNSRRRQEIERHKRGTQQQQPLPGRIGAAPPTVPLPGGRYGKWTGGGLAEWIPPISRWRSRGNCRKPTSVLCGIATKATASERAVPACSRARNTAEVGGNLPDAIARHNPLATMASRGCPVGCWFCLVPAMEGRSFTLLQDFPVRRSCATITCRHCRSSISSTSMDFDLRLD